MRLYLSSAMRSRTVEEYEKTFADAAAKLRAAGHQVHSLRDDFLIICTRIDAVVMLEPWRQSHGARAEHDVAAAIGCLIYYSVDDVPSLARSCAACTGRDACC